MIGDQGTSLRRIWFALAPNFSLLAYSSAIEPLRVANQVSRRMLYDCRTVSSLGGPVIASCGTEVATSSLPELKKEDFAFVCGGLSPCTQPSGLANWIGRGWSYGATVGGLCTGAYSLARAGLLDRRRFTLHWENLGGFVENFPNLTPVEAHYCIDGRIITSGGGISSADLMLSLIESDFGHELALRVRDMMLFPLPRGSECPVRLPRAQAIDSGRDALIAAVGYLETHSDEELSIGSIASAIGRSRRQVERLFRTHLDITPTQYLADLRLERACVLMQDTSLGITDVALAVGFPSDASFRKHYRRRFGTAPRVARKPVHSKPPQSQTGRLSEIHSGGRFD